MAAPWATHRSAGLRRRGCHASDARPTGRPASQAAVPELHDEEIEVEVEEEEEEVEVEEAEEGSGDPPPEVVSYFARLKDGTPVVVEGHLLQYGARNAAVAMCSRR